MDQALDLADVVGADVSLPLLHNTTSVQTSVIESQLDSTSVEALGVSRIAGFRLPGTEPCTVD